MTHDQDRMSQGEAALHQEIDERLSEITQRLSQGATDPHAAAHPINRALLAIDGEADPQALDGPSMDHVLLYARLGLAVARLHLIETWRKTGRPPGLE